MPDDPMITDERPQRHYAGAWVVLLIGVVGLGIGVWQWRGSFENAFAERTDAFKTPTEIETERLEEMKGEDTDKDGLNDYEESYVYQTSPYLADSDSDGTDDRTELAKGEDPNCPPDKECSALSAALDASATRVASSSAELAAEEQAVIAQLLNPDPAQIRQLLIQSGVKPETIADIDDATLLELYSQALIEAQANLPSEQ